MKTAKLQKQAIMLIERLPKKKLKAAVDYSRFRKYIYILKHPLVGAVS